MSHSGCVPCQAVFLYRSWINRDPDQDEVVTNADRMNELQAVIKHYEIFLMILSVTLMTSSGGHWLMHEGKKQLPALDILLNRLYSIKPRLISADVIVSCT